MKKYIFFVLLGLGLLPIFVGAETTSDVSQRIREILTQIAKLQAELKQLQGNFGDSQRWCHNFERDIRVGDRGEEVQALRIALNGGDVTKSSDAEFNEGLASQVVAFQEGNADEILKPLGLAHGSGYVGQATRRWLNRRFGCGGDVKPYPVPQPPKPIPPIVNPTSRLQVISPNGGEVWLRGSDQVIKWKTSLPVEVGVATVAQPLPLSKVNIYLIGPSGGHSLASQIENTGSFNWSVGKILQPNTNASEGMRMFPDGAYSIQVCLNSSFGPQCDRSDNFFKIISGDGQNPPANRPPVISGVSGPTVLKLGEEGRWEVRASDPANGQLSYNVIWGDETTVGTANPALLNRAYVQTSTFTHSYSRAGNYQPIFVVTNTNGQVAKTSLSVHVNDSFTVGSDEHN